MKKKILTYFVAYLLGVALFIGLCYSAWVLNTYENAKYWALAALLCGVFSWLLYPIAVKIINYSFKK